jgi:hypothetical protein
MYTTKITGNDSFMRMEYILTGQENTILFRRLKGILASMYIVKRNPGEISIMSFMNFTTMKEHKKYVNGTGLGRQLFQEALCVLRERWQLGPDALVTLEASGIRENDSLFSKLQDQTKISLMQELYARVGSASMREHRVFSMSKFDIACALFTRMSTEQLCTYYTGLGFRRRLVKSEDIYYIPMEAKICDLCLE